jgi:hypothetical protein
MTQSVKVFVEEAWVRSHKDPTEWQFQYIVKQIAWSKLLMQN